MTQAPGFAGAGDRKPAARGLPDAVPPRPCRGSAVQSGTGPAPKVQEASRAMPPGGVFSSASLKEAAPGEGRAPHAKDEHLRHELGRAPAVLCLLRQGMALQGYPVDGALEGGVQELDGEGDGADAGKHGGFRKAPPHDEGQGHESAAEQDDLAECLLVAPGGLQSLEGVARGEDEVPGAFAGKQALDQLHESPRRRGANAEAPLRRGAFTA